MIVSGETIYQTHHIRPAFEVAAHSEVEAVEIGILPNEAEEVTWMSEMAFASEAAPMIVYGTEFYAMTEIWRPPGGTMSTDDLGRTRIASSINTDEIHLFGQIQGIRPQLTLRHPIQVLDLSQISSARIVQVMLSEGQVQTPAGDPLVPISRQII